ncbi:MAG: phosphate ABC transporter permease PstA, partial [Wohlfahrtiimonas sp.]
MRDEAMATRLQARRRFKNRIAIVISMIAVIFGLVWLAWILYSTVTKGMG